MHNNDVIDSFSEQNDFLSNFYECALMYDGIRYRNSEAAFQAQKTISKSDRIAFSNLSASESKRLGRHVKLRDDWEAIKDGIMYDIVKAKFDQNHQLSKKLLETKDAYLIEGNYWNDTYWGVCEGKGLNKLGTILMRVRSELGVIE